MNDERRNGNGGGGGRSGGGRDQDAVDFESSAHEPTVVIVSDEYTRRAIGKLDGGLRGAADRCSQFVALGSEASSEPEALVVLEELEGRLAELELNVAGAKRAVGRHRRERAAKLAALAAKAAAEP